MLTRTLVATAILTALGASAAEITIKDGASDWTLATSYEGEQLPASGDIVVIPTNGSVSVLSAASVAIINTLDYVKMSDKATITFDVPAGDPWTVTCEVAAGTDAKGYGQGLGTIVKDGPGELKFNAPQNQTKFLMGNVCYDYYTEYLTVNAGTLTMRQNGKNREMFYGNTYVAKGAKLVTNTNGESGGGSSCFNLVQTLTGEGEVSGGGKSVQFRVNNPCTFAGKFTDSLQIAIPEAVDLTGTDSTTAAISLIWLNSGDAPYFGQKALGLGVMKFGMRGQSSSLGTNNDAALKENYAGYRYLGTGETTDKYFYISQNHTKLDEFAFFDAGANGGVTFTGQWYGNVFSKPWASRLFLTGSNTAECVLNNDIKNMKYDGVEYPFLLCKRGSGAWRFANKSNTFAGSIAIDEGTLRYDNLEDAGHVSSLGKATVLLDHVGGDVTDASYVDWSYRLGENTLGDANTEGTFEYTGTQGVAASGRSFALKGDGRLLNNTDARVCYSGFKAIAVGNHTLTLDGTGANTNRVMEVKDGDGTVSVVKNGTGVWSLEGESTFSGTLAVNGGTLFVSAPTTNYTWFLLSVTDIPRAQICTISKLGLYDANGARLNGNLKAHGQIDGVYAGGGWSALEKGETCYRSHAYFRTGGTTYGNFEQMFWTTHHNDNCWQANPCDASGNALGWDKTNPNCWFHIVMRLTNTVESVASYDMFMRHGRYNLAPAAYSGATNPGIAGHSDMPKTYALYGSTDGLNWDVLHDVKDTTSDDPALNCGMPLAKDKGDWAYFWLSSTNHYADADAKCHHGHPISGARTTAVQQALCNVTSVTVSNGGVLKANGANIAPLRGLTVDCAAAAGTVDGFAFAETGTLTVTNLDRSSADAELPVTFANVTDLANVSGWSLSANGAASNRRLVVRNGKIHALASGISVILR